MVKNSKGFLSGNTRKLKKVRRPTISDITKSFSIGEDVVISVKPKRSGAPHLRYQGRTGTIKERMGNGYVVGIKDGNKYKKIVATAFHLKSVAIPKR